MLIDVRAAIMTQGRIRNFNWDILILSRQGLHQANFAEVTRSSYPNITFAFEGLDDRH